MRSEHHARNWVCPVRMAAVNEWPPEGSPLAVTPEMEQMMKKMNYPITKVGRERE